jgi:hypothetical protein
VSITGKSRWVGGLTVALLTTLAGACQGGSNCDRQSLVDELSAAQPGERVDMGACRVMGPLTVPSGVRLVGSGREASAIVAPEGESGVILQAGDPPSRLQGVTVEASGCVGVLATGEGGAAELRRTQVRAARGVGVGAEGLQSFSMRDVQLVGPITEDNADQSIPLPPYTCEKAEPATHGLVIVDSTAELRAIDIRGFAAFGALLVGSDVQWQGGEVERNVGAGIEAWAGQTTLEGIRLCGALQGTTPTEAYNGVFGGDGRVETTGLTVCEGDSYGLMHDGATAIHRNLVARDNGFAGVWAQNGASLEIMGEGTELSRNGFAAVAAVREVEARVEGATLEGTREGVALVGQTGSIEAADGLHLVDSAAVLRNMTVRGNERIGLLFDLQGGATSELQLQSVTVEGSGNALGAVAQNGNIDPQWDEGIERIGDVASNDQAFDGTLDVAEAVGPSFIPAPGQVAEQGLGELVGMR